MFFANSCSVIKKNERLIENERMMWEIVSDNEFNPKKITNMIDSTYSKTFDSKVKYEITEVDCCNKGENTIIIKTLAEKSTESITFYFNDKSLIYFMNYHLYILNKRKEESLMKSNILIRSIS